MRVTPAKNTDPLARSGAPSARPFGPPVIAAKQKGESPFAQQERRRAQRVTLRVSGSVHVSLHGKPASFRVTTASVSSTGALLVVERGLPQETRLVLEHGRTHKRVACRVTRPAREVPEGFQVAIEFDSPVDDFWGIAFPPSDWRPSD